jgi:hypothetical protein
MTHISGNILGRDTTKLQTKCGTGNEVNIKILANLYRICV